MPVDASVYNNLNTTPYNPLTTLGNVANIANTLQQNQILQTQKQRQQIGLSADQAALALTHYNNIQTLLAPLATDKNLTQSKMLDTLGHAIASGMISPQDAAAETGTWGEDNPQDNRTIVLNHLVKAQSAADQMKTILGQNYEVRSGGGITQGVLQSPLEGGGFNPATSEKMTFTPGEKAARVPVVINGVPSSVPQSDLSTDTGEPKDTATPSSDQSDNLMPKGTVSQAQIAAQSGTNNPALPAHILPTGYAPGTQEAAQGSVVNLNNLYNANAGANDRIFQLKQALTGLENTTTGPGTATTNNIKSFLLAQSPDALKKIGINPDDIKKIASYDEANKYLTQYASGQASSLGQGTDAKLAVALSGNASTSISNLAAKDVVKAAIGLEKMRKAQADAFAQSGTAPGDFNKWQTNWNKNAVPEVYMMDELSPSKRAAVIKGLSPSERAAFPAQLRFAIKNGYVSLPNNQAQ